jgi:hypothetical protein
VREKGEREYSRVFTVYGRTVMKRREMKCVTWKKVRVVNRKENDSLIK